MPQNTCALQPFEGTQQFEVPYGTTITDLNRIVHGPVDWNMTVCRRPIVPIWGVALNAATGTYDFLPSTKGNEQTLISIAQSCLQASINYAQDIISNEIYAPFKSPDYGDYLARKIASDTCLQDRYLEVFNKAAQFFRLHGAIAAFDLPLYKELTDLIEKIMRESDKQMFIPSGLYTFLPGSAAQASLETWFAADPTFEKLYSIELITT